MVGKYPIQNLKAARDEAKKTLASVALVVIEEPTTHITFNEACDRFLVMIEGKHKTHTVYEYKRLLKRHFKFGSRQLAQIERINLQRCLMKLASIPTEHKHAYAVVHTFFNWAYQEELIEKNPLTDCKSLKPDRRVSASYLTPNWRPFSSIHSNTRGRIALLWHCVS